jgi:hypothetical protein
MARAGARSGPDFIVSLFVFLFISVFYLSLIKAFFTPELKNPAFKGGVGILLFLSVFDYKSAPPPLLIISTRLRSTITPDSAGGRETVMGPLFFIVISIFVSSIFSLTLNTKLISVFPFCQTFFAAPQQKNSNN